jgi:hypothetical protein
MKHTVLLLTVMLMSITSFSFCIPTGNTRTTAQAGLASDPNTWAGNVLPIDGDNVVVDDTLTWDIDCIGNAITLNEVTINEMFTISTGTFRFKDLIDNVGITLDVAYANSCGNVSTSGATSNTTINTFIIEDADSIFVNRNLTSSLIMCPVTYDPCYFKNDSLLISGTMQTPGNLHDGDTPNLQYSSYWQRSRVVFTIYEAGWRNMGSPGITNTLADLIDDFETTGFPGSAHPSFSFSNVSFYDESIAGGKDTGWVAPSGASQLMDKGFVVWFQPGVYTFDWYSDLLTGAYQTSLSYTNNGGMFHVGWNFLKNPFHETIHGDSLQFTGNVPGAYYIWDGNQHIYKYRSIINHTGSMNDLIPPGQCFFVKVNDATPATMTIPNSARAGILAPYRDESVVAQLSHFILSNEMSQYTTGIFVSSQGTTQIDNMDVYELNAHATNVVSPLLLYSVVQEQSIALQSLSSTEDTLYAYLYGKSDLPTLISYLSLEATDEVSLPWQIQWVGSNEWLSLTTAVLIPEGTLSSDEQYIGTLRLIQETITEDERPNEWSTLTNNNVKDVEHSDVTSGITEVTKKQIVAHYSNDGQITFDDSVEVTSIYNMLGQTLDFRQLNSTTCTVKNFEEGLLFISTKNNGLIKFSPVH